MNSGVVAIRRCRVNRQVFGMRRTRQTDRAQTRLLALSRVFADRTRRLRKSVVGMDVLVNSFDCSILGDNFYLYSQNSTLTCSRFGLLFAYSNKATMPLKPARYRSISRACRQPSALEGCLGYWIGCCFWPYGGFNPLVKPSQRSNPSPRQPF